MTTKAGIDPTKRSATDPEVPIDEGTVPPGAPAPDHPDQGGGGGGGTGDPSEPEVPPHGA